MQRTKQKEDAAIMWKKIGGGSFRMGNRIIKPGQKFSARVSEIPKGFRHIVVPLDKLPADDAREEIKSVPSEYSIKHRTGKWYDVINANGKVLNEKAMTRVKALELIKLL